MPELQNKVWRKVGASPAAIGRPKDGKGPRRGNGTPHTRPKANRRTEGGRTNFCNGKSPLGRLGEFPRRNDFLTDAAQVAGANALVLHEQASTAFMERKFAEAEQLLMHALRLLVGDNNASIRVPLLLTNNKMPSTIVRTVINNRIKRLNN
ncbi:hypothetical protein niasHT_037726 [Heterodera trifolii]|uniref:Uncharacterized protein n=1 Tax=Heterodera trifolii TaxID=157864 RepID=A0ABD2J7M6_9BILA